MPLKYHDDLGLALFSDGRSTTGAPRWSCLSPFSNRWFRAASNGKQRPNGPLRKDVRTMTTKWVAGLVIGTVMLTSAGAALAKKFPLTADKSVPAASGQVDVGRDKNGNTRVEIEVKHLALPESLTPPRAVYLVWFQERGSEPSNQGALKPNKSLKATFRGVTPMKSFDIVVTAESDASAKAPSGTEVLRASVQP
jgi:hypothetical protein